MKSGFERDKGDQSSPASVPGEGDVTALPGEVPGDPKSVAPVVAPLEPAKLVAYDSAGRKLWSVGTLSYAASGLVLLFCWLLWGDFALSMRDRSVGPLIEKFLLKNGASNTLKQVLTATLPTVIGLILGPAISYMSDRTRSRRGRRIPYLLVPTPIAGVAMIGIAFSPQIGEWIYRATGHVPPADVSIHIAASTYTLWVFTVFWTIFETAVIISGSVFFGLINDVVPRPVLGRFHGLFRAISLYDGILFNAILFQHAEQHFTLMFALIGILFGGGFTLMCLKVKEGEYPPPPPEEARFPDTPAVKRCVIGGAILGAVVGVVIVAVRMLGALQTNPGLLLEAHLYVGPLELIVVETALCMAGGWLVGVAVDRKGTGGFIWWLLAFVYRFFMTALGYLRECFTQPYYLLCFGFFTLAALTFRPINDFTIRYAAQLKMPDSDYGFLVAISYVMSLILAFPLGMLVDRFHPLRMAILSLVLYCMTALYAAVFVHDQFTFGIALVLHTVLSGTYFTCAASLGQQLLPRSKFSQYMSASGIVTSLALLVYAPTMGKILDLTETTTMVDGAKANIYNYQLIFWGGLILAALTMLTMLVVYHRFVSFGGTKGYVGPGDDEAVPSRLEPPAHMLQIISLYMIGAAVGVAAGYVLAFFVQPGAVSKAGVGLTNFHTLINDNKDVRNIATFCVATGLIPFTVLGGWAGAHLAKKRKPGASAHV